MLYPLENSYCLDPSCFTSLNILKDTLKVVYEVCKENRKIFIPGDIFKAIDLPPDKKFLELPKVIDKWIDDVKSNIKNLTEIEKIQYVGIIKSLFSNFELTSLDNVIVDEKIGDRSIHLIDLIKKFGEKTGKIIFQMIAASSELKIRIIGFGHKTINLIRKNGSAVLKFSSKTKKEIKRRHKIKTTLIFMMFLIETNAIEEIFTGLPIMDFLTIPELATLGILLVGNG